jgi:uncharacterized caspase-like protein
MARKFMRGAAFAGMLLAPCALAGGTLAEGAAEAHPPARLALVVGEAAYAGARLPTAANDAGLVARTLAAEGFEVTELEDLNAADLASAEQAFVAKARSTPAGGALVAYFGGLAVNVGCDDYLLPVGARITTQGEVPRVALSMTRVMADLADSGAAEGVVLLDGARPIPPSVSLASFPKGLIALTPPAATAFALSAELGDFAAAPKPGDTNGAYALALAASLKQPYGDIETTLRETRLATHQVTAGAQTPWHMTDPQTPPFVFPLEASDADIEAAEAALPDAARPIGGMPEDSAYWAAIWGNTIDGYQAYLQSFATAAPERAARVRALIALLRQPVPRCVTGSSTPPPARAAVGATAPVAVITAPVCPDGFAPSLGAGAEFCAPIEIATPCPVGTIAATIGGQAICSIVNGCPIGQRPVWLRGRFACLAEPGCPAGLRSIWNGDAWACRRPPYCRPGSAPVWGAGGFACRPPRDCGARGAPAWTSNGWACRPMRPPPPPPGCKPGQRGCLPPPLPPPGCKPGQRDCVMAPQPGCKPGQRNCLPRPERPPFKSRPKLERPAPARSQIERPALPRPRLERAPPPRLVRPVAPPQIRLTPNPPRIQAPKPFMPTPRLAPVLPKPAPVGAPAGRAPGCGAAEARC